MRSEPPTFQEAARCDVCKCSFNTFRRRHHCRCCGRTLCHEHSSNQMALPQFGIHSPVRVCADCFNNSSRSVFNHGQVSNGTTDIPQMDYEVNGEGLREAIKNGDVAAVRKLLGEGVDANYHDKQGLSLLHLAAVFNRTEITFILMEYGASMDYKNAQGETPLDCAPATLQHKMRQKMEESRQPGVNQNA
ncbi:vacuolar protein sorting-associated protein 27 isoform X2 [Carica papaya]|uniref:vacuolar protein sorting-associated protein 27 isoform X2 n=1 Tax=Carica papaya TaxID=3649 RepID=UPI000B8CD878|nr:vacuolar protein sorting-associated protein 27 isoform X2 [Carica papaya]